MISKNRVCSVSLKCSITVDFLKPGQRSQEVECVSVTSAQGGPLLRRPSAPSWRSLEIRLIHRSEAPCWTASCGGAGRGGPATFSADNRWLQVDNLEAHNVWTHKGLRNEAVQVWEHGAGSAPGERGPYRLSAGPFSFIHGKTP